MIVGKKWRLPDPAEGKERVRDGSAYIPHLLLEFSFMEEPSMQQSPCFTGEFGVEVRGSS